MKKIMLVEDDRFLTRMYVDKLSREQGFTIKAYSSGEEAWPAILKEKPDLILLDIILMDMNGVQLLKQVKENQELRDIPVLMLTNLNDRNYIHEALSLGADGYLIKAHFTPNEVIDKIKQILRSR